MQKTNKPEKGILNENYTAEGVLSSTGIEGSDEREKGNRSGAALQDQPNQHLSVEETV